jgi:hypothetical protein
MEDQNKKKVKDAFLIEAEKDNKLPVKKIKKEKSISVIKNVPEPDSKVIEPPDDIKDWDGISMELEENKPIENSKKNKLINAKEDIRFSPNTPKDKKSISIFNKKFKKELVKEKNKSKRKSLKNKITNWLKEQFVKKLVVFFDEVLLNLFAISGLVISVVYTIYYLSIGNWQMAITGCIVVVAMIYLNDKI